MIPMPIYIYIYTGLLWEPISSYSVCACVPIPVYCIIIAVQDSRLVKSLSTSSMRFIPTLAWNFSMEALNLAFLSKGFVALQQVCKNRSISLPSNQP